ncbi:DUF2225 domain-containing protein [Gorillibacterium sp. sgz5001074]|uniref:DUF2225 domain-containing protein n=1 Tax=Gorillibacterium sp. sgz5001074 TaxID=3446695 RepID=UPI003F67A68B
MQEGVHPLFQVKVDCLCCGYSFQTSRVRPSFKRAKSTESDFYVHYKDINPEYYVVRVCPFCGFATTENFSEKLTEEQRGDFELRVRVNWTMKDYGGERTWAEALQTYKLALLCAQIKGEKDRILSGLLHHIAWLYREKGDTEQEKRFLDFALASYVKVFENEGMDINNARLMYLIGELNRRLGNYYEAVKWFSRVINDKKIMDSAMIRACREMWATTREDMLAAKLDLPDEMKEQEKKK